MYRFVKRMIALGLLVAVTVANIGCTARDDKEEEAKQLVIISSDINIEQSSSDIKINRCKTPAEFKDAIEEIDTSNIQFAPEGYSGTTYDKNCVFMMTTTSATFTLDAEHMVSVAEHINFFYIQYDSSDSAAEAMEAMEEIKEMDKGVFSVTQDKAALYNEERLC